MKEVLFKYLQFLIPKYKCVTLPEIGAFILNKDSSNQNSISNPIPPAHRLSFNSLLTHDDGILISFHQKIKSISYEQATKEITSCLKELRTELQTSSYIEFGTLGYMRLVDDKLFFTPNRHYFIPKNFGLTPVKLQPLHIKTSASSENVKSKTKPPILEYSPLALAVAAVIAVVFIISINSVPDIKNEHEQAGFLQTILSPAWINTPKLMDTLSSEADNETADIEETNLEFSDLNYSDDFENSDSNDNFDTFDYTSEIAEDNTEEQISENFSELTTLSPSPKTALYYLIVGGSPSEETANKILANFKDSGFANASILESPGRFRVHIGKFETKAVADSISLQFKKEYPRYASAWIYTEIIN